MPPHSYHIDYMTVNIYEKWFLDVHNISHALHKIFQLQLQTSWTTHCAAKKCLQEKPSQKREGNGNGLLNIYWNSYLKI